LSPCSPAVISFSLFYFFVPVYLSSARPISPFRPSASHLPGIVCFLGSSLWPPALLLRHLRFISLCHPTCFPFRLSVSLPLHETDVLMIHSLPTASCPPVYHRHGPIKGIEHSPTSSVVHSPIHPRPSVLGTHSRRGPSAIATRSPLHGLTPPSLSHPSVR
jgi:hypothetical protein